jgi:peptidoglycan/LPS O-acetylase OafA/YrhL
LIVTAIDYLPYIFGFWVVATMLHPYSWSTRLLELPALRYVGRLSYSIYIWQQLFFWSTSPYTKIAWPPLLWASREYVHYVVVLGVAALSYHFVEKPMIRLGHRIAAPATPGHQDLEVDTAASAKMELT